MNDTEDGLHYTALELAEIKSAQVLATGKNKQAEKDTTAERTIVFVASDNSEDRAHERVEIATFYLPTKNGGLVRVADLAESKTNAVDIPLLTDHNGWEVDKVIGSVRSATFGNDYNQDVLLHEKPVARSLFGRKVCAGYATATSTPTTPSIPTQNDNA